jgi:hypothetical protein
LNNLKSPSPPFRRIRAYAFDPLISQNIETSEINEITIKLPWVPLEKGPVDDYLEVVDVDPASQVFYHPLDLNDSNLLAQDGLPPSQGNPQFHQQMVYAVARTTIQHFEEALGRRAIWSPYRKDEGYEYVEKLRVYPHAIREANAYYSPDKKALLFGYFPTSPRSGENLPGGMVFTCLSHDIVAHEMSHALLDGLHRRLLEPSNIDSWALHEGFADLVALFQHFTYPDVLRGQIARTRGDLASQNLLSDIAYQFGQALGQYGALRSALGHIDPKTKLWVAITPDQEKINHTFEPHDRGAILVAAIFDAFLTIYRHRTRDLFRIATEGKGILPPGDIHPDLVDRLTQEASKASRHFLQMCIRAFDFTPPVDVDFGDYLRALITADYDLVSDDKHNYRLAVIEGFRRWGIYPRDVKNLSEEALLWHRPTPTEQEAFGRVFTKKRLKQIQGDWTLTTSSREVTELVKKWGRQLHGWLMEDDAKTALDHAHIVHEKNSPEAFYLAADDYPALEVHSVRPANRVGPDGQTVNELVVEITQRRKGYLSEEDQREADNHGDKDVMPDFVFRGGCTFIIDTRTANVKYCIYKRIRSEDRLKRMRDYLNGEEGVPPTAEYAGDPRKLFFSSMLLASQEKTAAGQLEPFALLHRMYRPKEEEE